MSTKSLDDAAVGAQGPALNTDRELWRETEGDYYAPSIFVTARGGIGINVGGFVVVKTLREWHALGGAGQPFPAWSTHWYERRAPKRFGITKMVRTDSGDGWKDTGKRGDVAFVYAWELPPPYGAGQFPEVGNPISTAGAENSTFACPTIGELIRLLPKLIHDRRDALNRSILKRHKRDRDSAGR